MSLYLLNSILRVIIIVLCAAVISLMISERIVMRSYDQQKEDFVRCIRTSFTALLLVVAGLIVLFFERPSLEVQDTQLPSFVISLITHIDIIALFIAIGLFLSAAAFLVRTIIEIVRYRQEYC